MTETETPIAAPPSAEPPFRLLSFEFTVIAFVLLSIRSRVIVA